jgi:hypothetical protein
MKPVYTAEVAQEIGYQKFRPELHDWIFATAGCLVFVFGIVGLAAWFVPMLT